MTAELATTLTSTPEERLLQAEALVRSYCGWHIAPQRTDVQVTLPASTSPVLVLPSLHVSAVTSVTQDGVTVDPADYSWSEAGVLTRTGWAWTTSPVVVTFTHGYAEVPAEVSAVVKAVAQRAVDNPGSRPREQAGPFADTYSQVGFNQAPAIALLDAEKAALDHYRLPPRP